ncbi:MAG: Stk1 family PASTA domain-containing Ser/Thr kinase [Syntrophomonadaceae bacterium]|nr:Stk1 family PASTA domain-containing Ser/Thr kinase [Syntrophomonadaceae bacterium]
MESIVLGDRYELLEKIGEGGMAAVYKARCRILDRIVAVKILKEEYSNDSSFIAKFKTEATAAAQLSHPNIVNIFDIGYQDNIYYIVMEYIEGKTLKDVISERAPLPVEEAVNIAVMICDGLHHAHEKGIIHKDIKPHNILVTATGIVKVADFGIAQAIDKKTITFGRNLVGSVHYISPEQARGEPVNRTTDIYSAGCVLYEMLTAKTPFDAESPVTIALKHIYDEPAPPGALNSDIPPALEGIILKAMAKRPKDRFPTAEEFRNSLLTFNNSITSKHLRRKGNEKTLVMSPISTGKEADVVKKRRIRPTGMAIILIAILGFLSGIVFVMSSSLFGEEIVVPDVIGMDVKDADEELNKVGLEMKVIAQQFSDEFDADQVISQDPSAGQKVKEGREIEVILSKGPEMQKVPGVVGLVLADAKVQLQNAGLKVGQVEEIYDDKYEKDIVISQNPHFGTQVRKGSSVDLMVSKGKAPEKVVMPDLTGLTLEEAREKLEQNKLLVGEVKREESNEYFADQVISQDIPPGVLVDEQSSVAVVLSKGPGPVSKVKPLEIKLPEEQDYYKVVVKLKDSQGERELYNEVHRAGDKVYIGVNYFGSAVVEVYLNGEQYKTYSF